MALEIGLTWVAVVLYILGSLLGWVGLFWHSERAQRWLLAPFALGVVVHLVPIVMRWLRIGHGPYINAFEVLSASVWVGAALLLAFTLWQPLLRLAAGPGLGISMLLLGWGVMSNPEVQPLPPTFKGVWLVIHIVFAKIAFGCILVASGMAFVHMVRSRGEITAERKKTLAWLDEQASRLVGLGFVAITFMIAAGAIWARDAWGRYWSWDPLETWSLATWAGYGLYLHVRLAYRIKGRVSAGAIFGLLILSILAFFVIALVLPTVHNEFMVN